MNSEPVKAFAAGYLYYYFLTRVDPLISRIDDDIFRFLECYRPEIARKILEVIYEEEIEKEEQTGFDTLARRLK